MDDSNSRDGRANGVVSAASEQLTSKLSTASTEVKNNNAIRPSSRKFAKYVDYNLTSMTDTKGGFLSVEDDPHNPVLYSAGRPDRDGDKPGKADSSSGKEIKPAHMSLAEWERHQLIRNLRRQKAGPYEPGISVLRDKKEQKRCREDSCQSLEIDPVWDEVFGARVCARCKTRFPEKYSLLTKTEVRTDYMITDEELRDTDRLKHLAKPNPHKRHWHDMMLFLRYQVEEYAINKKWGSEEKMDEEYERREKLKKERKEKKFKERLEELRKKTRTERYRRDKLGADVDGNGGKKAEKFGDSLGTGKHVHDWGNLMEDDEGVTKRKCASCGMEVEEIILWRLQYFF